MAFSLFESTLLVPKTEFKIDMENFFEDKVDSKENTK